MATNEQVLEKTFTSDDLANGGKLNPEQSRQFAKWTFDNTVLGPYVRKVTIKGSAKEIDALGVGQRVTQAATEGVAPGYEAAINTGKVTLTPEDIVVPFSISDKARRENIEGDNFEDTVIQSMAAQMANDMETLNLEGNKLGPAVVESFLKKDGADNKYVKDTFLALYDGVVKQIGENGHVINFGYGNINHTLFSEALRTLPAKYKRRLTDLYWIAASDIEQLYRESLAGRSTPVGDRAVTQAEPLTPYGVPLIAAPNLPSNPTVVEHVTLNGTTAVSLQHKNIDNVVVTPKDLGTTATAPYAETTDYTVDKANGTITRVDGGAITDGQEVKVTYTIPPVIILTLKNNIVYGLGQEVSIEKQRDIFKGANLHTIRAAIAVGIENIDACVMVTNIKPTVA